MWHASAALLNPAGKASPVLLWSSAQRATARQVLTLLLEGVGVGPLRDEGPRTTMHLRRVLSAEEIAGLDPAWLAIPPIDLG